MFTIEYEVNERNKQNEINTEAAFCMTYVAQLKKRLGFQREEIKKDGKLKYRYSMEIPVIRNKIARKCSRMKSGKEKNKENKKPDMANSKTGNAIKVTKDVI